MNNKVYNNFHQIGMTNSQAIPVPIVKKARDPLVRTMSELSIDAQLAFQSNETSELLLTEIKCLTKTTTDHAATVRIKFLFL